MKRAYHGDWMDVLPSRFINEIPDESVEKNEIIINQTQMTLILIKTTLLTSMKNIEAQVGIGIKRIKCLNGKNKKT